MSAGGGIIVVSDTHISVRSDPAHVARFCEFLNYVAGQGNRTCRTVVIAGDLFNFDLLDPSAETVGESDIRGRLAAILAKFPEIEEAFAGLLAAGINITVLPGNHDVELLSPGIAFMFRQAICRRVEKLGRSVLGSLEISSGTFLRLAEIHIEHGNRFDCDNLFDEASLDDVRGGKQPLFPLGSCMERRFASRLPHLDCRGFSSATPWPLLRAVVSRHGLSGGLSIILRYYITAFDLFVESFRRRSGESNRRETREPTLNSPRRTFHRLYLDRSVAFFAAVVWALLFPAVLYAARPLWLAGSGCLGVALLATLRGRNRYGAEVPAACRKGALALMEDSSITTVILGHSHEPVDLLIEPSGRRYLNSGAFLANTPAGCPYVFVTQAENGSSALLRYYL